MNLDRSHTSIARGWLGLTGAGRRAAVSSFVALALSWSLPASASRADSAEISAREQDGYGRLILTFDDPPVSETRLSGGILVVSFSKPVKFNVEAAGQGLPSFVTSARRDPDGMALRLALSRPVKVNSMAAGEKLYVDLLPEKWAGMPPPLPADVMADLNRRALDAESLKKELARVQTLPPATMMLTAGSNDERMRLTFSFSSKVEVRFSRDDRHILLSVPGETVFDAATARAALPPEISDFRTDDSGESLIVQFTVPEGKDVRGFSEDRGFVVDIGPAATPQPAAAAEPPHPEASKPPVKVAEVDGAPERRTADYSDDGGAHPPEAQAQARVAEHAAIPPAIEPPVPALIAPAPERAIRELAAAATEGVRVRTTETDAQIAFPFANLPAAASFMRGSTLFLVFDGAVPPDTSRIVAETHGLISSATTMPTGSGFAVEMTLSQSRLASLASVDKTWVLSLGDTISEPTRPLQIAPSFSADGHTSLHVSAEGIGSVHRVADSQVGDQLLVVTLRPPARGVVRDREFIEFDALSTIQGLAFEPHADDLAVKIASDEVTVTRDKGLTLSLGVSPQDAGQDMQLKPGSPFDAEAWRKAQLALLPTSNELARAAAAAPAAERTKARLKLARFQLANGNAAETKAILDVASRESPGLADDPEVRLLRGTALAMMRRFEEAVQMLSAGGLATNGEAALWRMIAEAGQGHIALARGAFRQGEPVLDAMPPELQRIFRQTMAEVAVAAQDYATAAAQLDALDVLKTQQGWAMREVVRGRIAEGFDQPALALEAYRRAMESAEESATAEARLRATNLRYRLAEIQRAEAVQELERLTAIWRGDGVEAVALASLTDLYKDDHRWRDAFTTMRTAMSYHPDETATRNVQDEMSAEFSRLFLGEGPDAAPPTLESVALFYDFKELTPPGRKGDELIRKLADRLVEVDLLGQAADLLTYQVENRLQGAARAQVAAHAAAIQLMDGKPGRALNVLHGTRLAGLPPDIVRSRLILEARALSELQRPDVALEMIAGYEGEDINRLRADILWSAHRWQSAAEGLEVMLGAAWKGAAPLGDTVRQDVLRAAIAYALAEDRLGLDRLRSKYGPKLAASPDQTAFDVITAPADMRGEEFRKVAKRVAVSDTLTMFLDGYRRRYPESAPPAVKAKEAAAPQKTADARG